SSALLRIEVGLDFGHGLHEVEIQTESIRGAFDLLNRCPNWKGFDRLQKSISRLLGRWNFRKNVISEKREVLLGRHQIRGMILSRVFRSCLLFGKSMLFNQSVEGRY